MAIKSFACKETMELWIKGSNKRFSQIASAALRRLDYLHSAINLEDLKSPPGNHLEKLAGDREDQCSIRINSQWRVCFRWTQEGVEDVEIVDYH